MLKGIYVAIQQSAESANGVVSIIKNNFTNGWCHFGRPICSTSVCLIDWRQTTNTAIITEKFRIQIGDFGDNAAMHFNWMYAFCVVCFVNNFVCAFKVRARLACICCAYESQHSEHTLTVLSTSMCFSTTLLVSLSIYPPICWVFFLILYLLNFTAIVALYCAVAHIYPPSISPWLLFFLVFPFIWFVCDWLFLAKIFCFEHIFSGWFA